MIVAAKVLEVYILKGAMESIAGSIISGAKWVGWKMLSGLYNATYYTVSTSTSLLYHGTKNSASYVYDKLSTKPIKKTDFTDLPDDNINIIISHLSWPDRVSFSQTSNKYLNLVMKYEDNMKEEMKLGLYIKGEILIGNNKDLKRREILKYMNRLGVISGDINFAIKTYPQCIVTKTCPQCCSIYTSNNKCRDCDYDMKSIEINIPSNHSM